MRRPSLDHTRLDGLSGGWRVEILESTPSTNAELASRARSGEASGLVITTEHQTAGRGRLDRGWTTPERSALTVSALLRPDPSISVERWPWLPLMTGVAVASGLRKMGYAAGLKWPNDVLIEGRKVCGILIERIEGATAESGAAAVIGFGLNTSLTREELPIKTATSLELDSGAPVDRTAVLAALLEELWAAYEIWGSDPAELARRYRELSVTVGEQVRAELPGGEVWEGVATEIDDFGRLVIATGQGSRVVGAGDVIHARLRPRP
ncbi:biotin--[acetyl-CoA-carboxylase] ligase [Nocardioides albus]|uniref:biotin--[biotin carboxyl-carrier protein] ligase n=1 Tax=Nocardioides albus TaxID=1841 RepID=A0A7W5A0I3_9ACTN|nr:biotin--[acetyl-CoA-carboxylase] ligase [Nocardioides albus]MBB3087215.1 BirA family biotin operon repressor/biotin-[acetyl-CoA-carboxylase] ligase [Nocardioides albus]GGU07442.1 biotin--[acetyl-CoA-carboxylase] ligase [Nocardioides albus]